jgi:hypothetical protein
MGKNLIFKKHSANGEVFNKHLNDRYEEKSNNTLKSGRLDFR